MPTQSLPPGSFGLPLLGELIEFGKVGADRFSEERHTLYGSVFKTKLLRQPVVFAKGAAANKFILSNDNRYFSSNALPSLQALLGDNSLSAQTGSLHSQRRRLLAKAFSPRALDSYVPAMSAITNQYLQTWADFSQLTWYPELRRYTFDVACKLLIGLDNAASSQLGEWFEIWAKGLFSLFPMRIPLSKFDRAYRCRNKILDALGQIIIERKKQEVLGDDALGILLNAEDETGNKLSIEELKDQILTLLFAGHETLTSALTSFCLLLAQHPEVKKKARQEINAFAEESMSVETLRSMTYLEQVIQETMRMIAPVGGGFRKVIEPCSIDGFSVPAGWLVIYSIVNTHKDEAVFPHPEVFDPERFRKERGEDRQPYSYMPFGGGVRECLGKEFARLEIKLFAYQLLKGYDWGLCSDQKLEMVSLPTPHPKDGLKVGISPI